MDHSSPLDAENLRDRVQAVLDEAMGRHAAVLSEVDASTVPLAEAVVELIAGGKRLRPAFCYWGWRGAGGEDDDRAVRAASALELFHAAALLHDDLIDSSDTRRGNPSAHVRFTGLHEGEGWDGDAERFGMAAAVLAGDLCLTWSAELLAQASADLPHERREAGRAVWDQMATQLMAGQYLDVLTQARPMGDDAVQRARQVIRFKTVRYTVEHPMLLGGHLAGASTDLLAGYSRYAVPLGEAFQLRDDVLGVFGDPELTGKPCLDDLREGKRTVLLALTHQRADADQRRDLDALVGLPDLDTSGVERVREVMVATGALEEVEAMIDELVDHSHKALEGAGVAPPADDVLASLVHSSTRRQA